MALTEGRPVVLLIGQDAWKSGTHADPVLEMALKRAGRHSTESASVEFPRLLQAEPLPEDLGFRQ